MGPATNAEAYCSLTRDTFVVADDRSSSSPVVSSLSDVSRGDAGIQSASFQIGSVRVELNATVGATRLVTDADGTRDTHVIDPVALAAWSVSTARLLTLSAAPSADQRAEFRAPYLVDREGRALIAVEGLVSENGVGYRLLLSRGPNVVTRIMTTAEVVRSMAEAAAGAAAVAHRIG